MLRSYAFSAIFVIASNLGPVASSLGQDQVPLRRLAERACESGAVGRLHSGMLLLLGYSSDSQSALTLRESDNTRFLYILNDACKDGRLVDNIPFNIMFANFVGKEIGIYFGTTVQGQLASVVQVIRGPEPRYKKLDPTGDLQVLFEAEKVHWLSKFALPTR